MHPFEHMAAMGLPVFQHLQFADRRPSGIEEMALGGLLSHAQTKAAMGNGMVQIAIGAFVIFGLGAVKWDECAQSSDPEI